MVEGLDDWSDGLDWIDWKWGNQKCGGISKVGGGIDRSNDTLSKTFPSCAITLDKYCGTVWALSSHIRAVSSTNTSTHLLRTEKPSFVFIKRDSVRATRPTLEIFIT
jgi:hypothetical protein